MHATNVLNQRKGSKDEPHQSPLLGTSSLQVPALFVCLQHATNHAGSSRRRIHRPSKPKAVVALQQHRFRCRTRYSTSTSVLRGELALHLQQSLGWECGNCRSDFSFVAPKTSLGSSFSKLLEMLSHKLANSVLLLES